MKKYVMGKQKGGIMGLVAGILEQAANDYIDALIGPDTMENHYQILNLEKFFRSKWGQELSLCQGEIIIQECKKIANEEIEKRKRDRMKHFK